MEEQPKPDRRSALKKIGLGLAALGFAYGVQRSVEQDLQNYYRPVRDQFKKMDKVEYVLEGQHFVFPAAFEQLRYPERLSDVNEMSNLFGVSADAVEKGHGTTPLGCYLKDGEEQFITVQDIRGHAAVIARVLHEGKKCERTPDARAEGRSR